MSIPTTIESLSTTAASNGPAGSEDRSIADDGLRQAYAFTRQLVTLGSNIASASSITPPSTGSVFNITGVVTITAIASTNSWDGRVVTFIFAAALTLTHGANLALPGSVNITTAANDVATFVQTASGAWRLRTYTYAAGGYLPLSGGTMTGAVSGITNLTTTGNTILGNAQGDTLNVAAGAIAVGAAGNVTIAAPGSGVAQVVNGFAGSNVANFLMTGADAIALIQSTTSGDAFLTITTVGVQTYSIKSLRSTAGLSIQQNGTEVIGIGPNRNVTIAAAATNTPALTILGSAATTSSAVTFHATAMTLDCTRSNVFTTTFTANVTVAPTISNPQDGQTFSWIIKQDATGTRTMTWPTTFKWPGGTVGVLSTAVNAVDMVTCTYRSDTGFFYSTLLKGFA